MDIEEKKKTKIQKLTQRILIAFVITMIALTILSKVANSITVPKVTVGKVGKGSLSYVINGSGTITALKEEKIDILSGLKISSVSVKVGQQINLGDELLKFDLESVDDAIFAANQELLTAQQDYQTKKNEYNRILEKAELTDAQKLAQEAKENWEEAKAALAKAQTRYDEKLSKLLSGLKESQAADYEQVTDALNKAKSAYDECTSLYDERVTKAKDTLQAASDQQAAAIRDAQRELDSAKLDCEEYLKNYNRVNNAFLAYTASVKDQTRTTQETLRNKMFYEYFGEEDYQAVTNNSYDSSEKYDRLSPIYDKLFLAVTDYENAVAAIAYLNGETKEQKDAKVKQCLDILYNLVVKPFEMDKVTQHNKELNVTMKQEALDKAVAENEPEMKKAQGIYEDTIKKLDEEKEALKEAYEKAQKAYDKTMSKVYEDSDSEDNLLASLESAKKQEEDTKKALKKAEEALTKEEKESLYSDSTINLTESSIKACEVHIDKMKEKITELEQLKDNDGVLTAEKEGTVTQLTASNFSTSTGEERIVFGSKDSYFLGTFSIDMMKYVEEGDEINLSLPGRQDKVKAIVNSVYLSADGQSACLEAGLSEGSARVGTTGTFEYTKNGEKADNCIDVTALRQDQKGYYILIPQETTSILGNVTKAYRVEVKVIKKDSRTAIIEGAVHNGDVIITGSSKMITEGDVIRTYE